MKRGLFIVIEGPDGSGKSNQINRLHKYIKFLSKYNDVLTTHEPWKNEELKKILREEKDAYSSAEKSLELFIKDRKSHLCHLINPLLDVGGIIISDRYILSTYAYQQTQGVDFEKIWKKHQVENIMVPDLTFLLDINLETALERIRKRGEIPEKFEIDKEFIQRNIDKYRELAVMSKDKGIEKILGRIEIIDGRKYKKEVFEQIKKIFNSLYEEWTKI